MMKTLHLAIIAFATLLLIPMMMNNPAKALCMSNSDWPNAPCYGDPASVPSKEKQREDWTPYYQYKGAAWMEMMKGQMIEAMRNGTLEYWVTGNQSNYDVWRYYYLNDQAPFFRSSISGLNDEHPYFPPPLQQLTTGITPKDVACKNDLNLVLKAEDGSPACVKPSSIAALYLRGWMAPPENGAIVFVIKPGTIGQIFVKYTNPLPDIDAELNTRLYSGNSGQEIHTTNLQVGVNSDTVPHGKSLVTTYNVVAQNTTGIYWLQIASCQFIPIAVATDSSQITNSDLQFVMSGWRCPVSFVEYRVVGISNMTVMYVEPRANSMKHEIEYGFYSASTPQLEYVSSRGQNMTIPVSIYYADRNAVNITASIHVHYCGPVEVQLPPTTTNLGYKIPKGCNLDPGNALPNPSDITAAINKKSIYLPSTVTNETTVRDTATLYVSSLQNARIGVYRITIDLTSDNGVHNGREVYLEVD